MVVGQWVALHGCRSVGGWPCMVVGQWVALHGRRSVDGLAWL